jgi:hypothetical protein
MLPELSSAGQAVCPHCGQAFSADTQPQAAAPAEPAALLLQCLSQALLRGAVTALGASLASAAETEVPGVQPRHEPAISEQDSILPGVEPEAFHGTARPTNGGTACPNPGRVVDAVFGAAAEDGLPDAAGPLAGLPDASGGDGRRRAEVALRAGLTAALQELQRGGLVDLVRALRAGDTVTRSQGTRSVPPPP